MAISFDWYENPVSPDQTRGEKISSAHHRQRTDRHERPPQQDQSRCTLNEVDVTACWTHYHKLWVKNCAKEGKCTWTVSVIFIRH